MNQDYRKLLRFLKQGLPVPTDIHARLLEEGIDVQFIINLYQYGEDECDSQRAM